MACAVDGETRRQAVKRSDAAIITAIVINPVIIGPDRGKGEVTFIVIGQCIIEGQSGMLAAVNDVLSWNETKSASAKIWPPAPDCCTPPRAIALRIVLKKPPASTMLNIDIATSSSIRLNRIDV